MKLSSMPKTSTFDAERDLEIIDRRVASQGFFRFEKLRLRHRRFDGSWSGEFDRELFRIPRAVCVLPYDPQRDIVLLIEQFRTGAIDHEGGPWLLECIAGLMEDHEDPPTTARREVGEEAGIEVDRLERVGVYAPSPGAVSERTTMFIARFDAGSVSAGIHGLDDENEDIRTHLVTFDQALELIDCERITAANAQLLLRWLQINRDNLRQRWGAPA